MKDNAFIFQSSKGLMQSSALPVAYGEKRRYLSSGIRRPPFIEEGSKGIFQVLQSGPVSPVA